ncbi:uncharacterized protein LOC141909797 [Tubulanus polymorphus]|uniref:uncharacterized protein LOC141909797 n=1 Tax=Tubulanus polymorphus TaxID=672921 RepID=UPI003DA5EE65
MYKISLSISILIVSSFGFALCQTVCTDGSGTHYEGGQWVYRCTRYTCSAGRTVAISRGCDLNDGSCLRNGEITTTGCTTYRCETGNGYIALKPIQKACSLSGGGCLGVGQSITRDCVKYTCLLNGNYKTLRSTSGGCKLRTGECIQPGQTYQHGCNSYVCRGTGNNHSLMINRRGCQTNKGCARLGQTYLENCVEYICTSSNKYVYGKRIRTQCMTAHNTCVAMNSSHFPCVMRGIYRSNCQCFLNADGSVTYRATIPRSKKRAVNAENASMKI